MGGDMENKDWNFKENGINTFSYQTKIQLKSSWLKDIEQDPRYKNCVEYMKIAEGEWINAKKFLYPAKTRKGIQEF